MVCLIFQFEAFWSKTVYEIVQHLNALCFQEPSAYPFACTGHSQNYMTGIRIALFRLWRHLTSFRFSSCLHFFQPSLFKFLRFLYPSNFLPSCKLLSLLLSLPCHVDLSCLLQFPLLLLPQQPVLLYLCIVLLRSLSHRLRSIRLLECRNRLLLLLHNAISLMMHWMNNGNDPRILEELQSPIFRVFLCHGIEKAQVIS